MIQCDSKRTCIALEEPEWTHIAIKLVNSHLNFFDRRHGHKPESTASSRQFVIDNLQQNAMLSIGNFFLIYLIDGGGLLKEVMTQLIALLTVVSILIAYTAANSRHILSLNFDSTQYQLISQQREH